MLFHIYGPFKSALRTKLAPFLAENILFPLSHSLCLSLTHTYTPQHVSVEFLTCSAQFQTMKTAFSLPALEEVLPGRAGRDETRKLSALPSL